MMPTYLRRGANRLPWAEQVPFRGSEPMAGGVTRRGITMHGEGIERRCTKNHTWLLDYVNARRVPYTLAWCGKCGYWGQMIGMRRAARSLKGGGIVPNGASANKAGQRNIQIVLLGENDTADFTHGPMRRAWVLAEIMDAHRIPWKARGNWGADASRSTAAWLASGVHGHMHSPAPAEDHRDPQNLDIERLLREARRQRKARK